MRGRWQRIGIAIAAAGIVVLGWRLWQSSNPGSAVRWQTANPVISPASARPLIAARPLSARIRAISLPSGQLPGADWYLPFGGQTSLAYILHDRQARWIVGGRQRPLDNPPGNPFQALVFAQDGRQLAWADARGVVSERAGAAPTVIAGAYAPYIAPDGRLQYLQPGSGFTEIVGPVRRRLPPSAETGSHLFVQSGTALVYDRHGAVTLITLSSGRSRVLARVNPDRWPQFVAAYSYGDNIAVLLQRTRPSPAYLLLVSSPHGVFWYRWQTGLTPTAAVLGHYLIVGDLTPDGHLVAVGSEHWHPTGVAAGLFSRGPLGIVFSSGSSFSLLTGFHP